MKIGFSASIDVTKIDKEKLVVGKKGKYLNITSFFDVHNKDQYENNGMITESVSKEQREAGQRGTILGNIKVFYINEDDDVPTAPKQNAQVEGADIDDLEDEVPW